MSRLCSTNLSRRLIGSVLRPRARAAGVGALVTLWFWPCWVEAQFVQFENETSARVSAPAQLVINDLREKDYAWGDVDNDGDIDLVVVRKQPFTSTGRDPNVLLMNEGGVLVDRTEEYATASDVAGDEGFKTPTNDRDVVLADINGDGWLDIVTAPTLTDNALKHLSHPRVYVNLGEHGSGDWLGFEFQNARIPALYPPGFAHAGPRFCSVAAGDLSGDEALDLYFGDYDSGPTQIFDFNNKLLINDGNGFFADQSVARMGGMFNYSDGVHDYWWSHFGASSVISDMNNDGLNDVVKQTSLEPDRHVAIVYNGVDAGELEGFFDFYDKIYGNQPYFVSVGYLNGDDLLDIVITDDGNDRFLIATTLDAGGHRNYSQFTFPNSALFGGNSVIADLNNDGLNDVIITDVDVDITGCDRLTHIYQNMGGDPPTFVEDTTVLSSGMRAGWHDVGVFDINGDGWLDLVAGRCTGTQVWMNQPPLFIAFDFPMGVPEAVTPDQEHVLQVQLTAIGDTLEPESATLHVAVNDAPFTEAPMTSLGEDLFEATLPATDCLDEIRFYFSAALSGAGVFNDPAAAPEDSYVAISTVGSQISLSDNIEGDTSSWTITSDISLTTGEWEQADPNATIINNILAAPDEDATAGAGNVQAFVTQNCEGDECLNAGGTDVDGGPTHLMSPIFDGQGGRVSVGYARWFFSNSAADEDLLKTAISNDDGETWVEVDATTGTNGSWEAVQFSVSDFVTPTSTMRVRFSVTDIAPPASVVEAGIDDLRVEQLLCEIGPCPADLDGDGQVRVPDLVILLAAWGPNPGHAADFDGDDQIRVSDLIVLLAAWGPC